MSFTDDFVEYLTKVIEYLAKVPDGDYIAGTAVSTAARNNGLFKSTTHIGSQTVTKVGNGWNYLDAATIPFLIAHLYYQNAADQVDDKVKQENKAKIALLSASFIVAITLTATGFGSIGFAIGTGIDFLSASYDFYDSAKKYWDYEYWLECQLFSLDHINRKIDNLTLEIDNLTYEIDNKTKDVDNEISELKKYKEKLESYKSELNDKKNDIINNIKNYSTNHYYNKFQDSQLICQLYENPYKYDFETMIDKIYNKNNFESININDYHELKKDTAKQLVFNQKSAHSEEIAKARESTQKIKSSLKADLNDKGVNLTLKTASMVGMTLLAVGTASAVVALHTNPVGLAISLSVAAGYLIYSFGLPAAKKVWNHYCDKQTIQREMTEKPSQQPPSLFQTFGNSISNALKSTTSCILPQDEIITPST
ncbi:hypothetical protein L3V82_03620 [Thiotrichales bacterium 19S3-7]|nr:hypothetical protein [Thiotrichales bacterium 19S3-7]MCF6801264.1 hypothetical protein [Thiotrichales bacterium 19S3-11]